MLLMALCWNFAYAIVAQRTALSPEPNSLVKVSGIFKAIPDNEPFSVSELTQSVRYDFASTGMTFLASPAFL